VKPTLVEGDNPKPLLRERFYGKFERRLRLPEEVDGDTIEATLDNGILILTLHKLPEVKPKQIPVRFVNGTKS
jgi:HSP20 family protein